MAFDLDAWKEKVREQLQGWKPRMERAGVNSVYAFLSAATLWPVVQAYQGGDLAAVFALANVLAGVGTNLLANRIQAWKDKANETEAAVQIATEVADDPALRAELDAVLEKLDALSLAAQALSDEDRQWFTGTLHAELGRLGNLARFEATLGGSGAIAQGPGAKAASERGVAANHIEAPVVTGDDSRAIQAEQYVEQQVVVQAPAEVQAVRAEGPYLKRLYQRCNVLPLAALGGEEGVGDEVTLEQVYVDLNTRTRVPLTDEDKARLGERMLARLEEGRLLPALEAATQNRRLVLLGDPGSGKSTFVHQLAAWLAATRLGQRDTPEDWEPGLLPVFTMLRELAPHLAGLELDGISENERDRRLVDAVWRRWQASLEEMRAAAFASRLEEALTDGQVLLIFDGLDEVAQGLRPRARQAVQVLLRAYPAVQRVVVTCRIRSYAGAAVLPGFATHTLAPFNADQIRQFAAAWYTAQAALGRLDEATARERGEDLQQAALSEDLRELASNPMLLTTMAIIHQREVGLPRERVRLYALAVQVLISRWQKRKGVAVSDRLAAVLGDDLKLRTILERLAYEAHRRQASEREEADLSRRDLLALLEEPEHLGDVGLTGEFLDYVDQRAGLLVGHGGDDTGRQPQTYRFPHRTFQEYLAGSYMVGQRGVAREYWQRVEEKDYWYLAAQLGAEELLYNRRSPQALMDLAYDLCPGRTPATDGEWRAALWSGQIAALLGPAEIQRDVEKPEGGAVYLGRLVPRLVQAMRESLLGAVVRADAGRALAKLGDARPEVMTIEEMQFCHVPAGAFLMGSTDADEMAYDDEKPQHEVVIPYDYWIARYPVTNAQFALFVEAGGYKEPRYWAEAQAAGVWRDGQVQRAHYVLEEDELKVVEAELGEAPLDFGEPYNLPNHPVVGVTWYEVLAFARWLEEQLEVGGGRLQVWQAGRVQTLDLSGEGFRVTLPGEAEWEKAARGTDGRIYAWGNEPDPERANYNETGIGTTSAVGCFPGGVSPYGVEELSGNVWEWTRSLWEKDLGEPDFKYLYNSEDGRENLEAPANVLRVLRGGAFYVDQWYVRCAFRGWDFPDVRYRSRGFRVVVSPFTSGL